jgi:hypothetical protein
VEAKQCPSKSESNNYQNYCTTLSETRFQLVHVEDEKNHADTLQLVHRLKKKNPLHNFDSIGRAKGRGMGVCTKQVHLPTLPSYGYFLFFLHSKGLRGDWMAENKGWLGEEGPGTNLNSHFPRFMLCQYTTWTSNSQQNRSATTPSQSHHLTLERKCSNLLPKVTFFHVNPQMS